MVRVLYLATETRLTRGPDGAIRSNFADTSFLAWDPFLEVFDKIVIVARVENSVVSASLEVEGRSISVLALPNYRGPRQMVLHLPRLWAVMRNSVTDRSAVFAGRAPGVVSTLLFAQSRKLGAESVAIVVGDPVEVAQIGAAGPVLRVLAPLGGIFLRWQLRHVSRASYVTEHVLQDRYPVRRGAREISASDVRLPPAAFAASPRDYTNRAANQKWRLVTVGSHEAAYKGHDFLLYAIALLAKKGDLALQLTIIGGGRHHKKYRELSERLGLEGNVEFVGHISDAETLRAHLLGADLFVFPSLTEGLPRALVEAMALALPCVATDVGGISELLPKERLVPPRNAPALARAIELELSLPEELNRQSRQNLTMARRIMERVQSANLVAFLGGASDPTPKGRA